jgi:hypothetical protein
LFVDPLLPYLAERPDGTREEHSAYCPLHSDSRPSMSINFRKGVWYCHAGCGGGKVAWLLDAEDTWIPKADHPAFARR